MSRFDSVGHRGRKINQKIYVKRVPRLQHNVERERERDEKEEVWASETGSPTPTRTLEAEREDKAERIRRGWLRTPPSRRHHHLGRRERQEGRT